MTPLVGIDPGTTRSAFVVLNGDRVAASGWLVNEDVLEAILDQPVDTDYAIERVEPRYGLRMGWETIATIEWVGRFAQAAMASMPAFADPPALLPRSAILRHLGVASKGNADSGVRMAMLDRWGGEAAARKGGPLHGLSTHRWQALAVAVAWREGLRP